MQLIIIAQQGISYCFHPLNQNNTQYTILCKILFLTLEY